MWAGLSLETVGSCPERMYAAYAEASRPPRIETGMALEAVLALVAVLALEVVVLEAVVDAL